MNVAPKSLSRAIEQDQNEALFAVDVLLTVPAAVEVGFVVYFAGGVAMIFGARAIMHASVLT